MRSSPFECHSHGKIICSLALTSKYIFFACSMILFSMTKMNAQRPLGSWNIVNAKLSLNDHWGLWAEGQVRSPKFYDEFNYFETKGGATYSFKDRVSLTAGIGRYETYGTGGDFVLPKTTTETRTWLQLILEQKFDRILFEHRYRVEQRHLNTGYKNRFRYRLNATIPVNHHDMIPKTLFAYIGDEVFFTDKAPYYERNRFFTGLGYKINPMFSIISGYMLQYNYTINVQSPHDYLQLALFINLNVKDFQKKSAPTTGD